MPEMLALDSLKEHPRNYREHPADQLDHIVASIEANGVYRNIVVANDKTILAGHGVAKAARRMGMTEIAAEILDVSPDSPEALKVLASDNEVSHLGVVDDRRLTEILKEVRESPVGLVGTGFDDKMLSALVRKVDVPPPDPPEPQPDRAEELQKKWSTELGQIWQIGQHRLACGDSTEADVIATALDGAEPYLCVTDPPYGVEYDPNWRNEAAEKGQLQYGARRIGVVYNDDRADWREV